MEQQPISESLQREFELRKQLRSIEQELQTLCPDPTHDADILEAFDKLEASLPEDSNEMNNPGVTPAIKMLSEIRLGRESEHLRDANLILRGSNMSREEIEKVMASTHKR